MDGDITALSAHPRDESGALGDDGRPGVAVNGVPNGYSAPDEMDAAPPTQTLAPGEAGPATFPLHTAGADDAAMDDPAAAAISADERRDEDEPHAVHHDQVPPPERAPGASVPPLHDRMPFEHWLRGDSLADLPALPAMPPESRSGAALPPPQPWSRPPALHTSSAPRAAYSRPPATSSAPPPDRRAGSHAPYDSGRAPATLPHFARRDAPHTPPPAALQVTPSESSWTPHRVHTLPAPAKPASGAVDRRRLASGDRRIFLASVACALALLALAVQVVWSRSLGLTGTSHSAATAASSNAPQAQIATPSPAATQPVATPTVAAPTATARPSTPQPAPTRAPSSTSSHSGAVYPLVSALRLSCGASGVALPLRNPSTVVRSWSIPLPPGVVANGWTGTVSGTVAPGGKLTLFLWQATGSQAGSRVLTVYSVGQQSTVRVSLGTC